MMDAKDATNRIAHVERILAGLDVRANFLIQTIFTDAIRPWGGNVWLGSLINLAAPFGLTDRLVRTGVYRLTRENWLVSSLHGRRAYYTLTSQGLDAAGKAEAGVYAARAKHWDKSWRLVQILPEMDKPERSALRRELKGLGFGQISSVLLAHPSVDPGSIGQTLAGLGLTHKALVFKAHTEDFVDAQTIAAVAHRAWPLGAMNTDYEKFLSRFGDLEQTLDMGPNLPRKTAFVLRIALIYEYRRLLLKDPGLPAGLLEPDWSGGWARELCARLYRLLAAAANAHAVSQIEIKAHVKPALDPFYWRRFGGLEKSI